MNDNEELSNRAISCKHWKWLPGMKCVEERMAKLSFFRATEAMLCFAGAWPDINDPATKGCLLELVRRSLPDHSVYITMNISVMEGPRRTMWGAHITSPEGCTLWIPGDSEGEVLVKVLEHAGEE